MRDEENTNDSLFIQRTQVGRETLTMNRTESIVVEGLEVECVFLIAVFVSRYKIKDVHD